VVLGLSGGIDSSLTAAIAVDALGPDQVVGVLMPSPHSSKGSVDDALALAKNLKIKTFTFHILAAMKAYEYILKEKFWSTEPGLAEENLQARIRGNLLMALSNKFGWMVLTTGNKSETSMGYCTLYGDMAGGFAVIKDVPKILVYKLARWLNREQEIIPQNVLTKEPSAELRPGQRDTDSLPPYDLLDPVLLRYIEEDCSIEEIKVSGLSKSEIQRIARLVDLNEYKRRQGPPGVKITPKAFGKDRRLPITTGRR
jgi:NAD+ synthase (glutamine-hydrolysing)